MPSDPGPDAVEVGKNLQGRNLQSCIWAMASLHHALKAYSIRIPVDLVQTQIAQTDGQAGGQAEEKGRGGGGMWDEDQGFKIQDSRRSSGPCARSGLCGRDTSVHYPLTIRPLITSGRRCRWTAPPPLFGRETRKDHQ